MKRCQTCGGSKDVVVAKCQDCPRWYASCEKCGWQKCRRAMTAHERVHDKWILMVRPYPKAISQKEPPAWWPRKNKKFSKTPAWVTLDQDCGFFLGRQKSYAMPYMQAERTWTEWIDEIHPDKHWQRQVVKVKTA